LLVDMVRLNESEVGGLVEGRGGRMLRGVYDMCKGRRCPEAPVFVGFWSGRHVDAGRRLYFLPLEVSLCLCGSIASDRWIGGNNTHDVIRRRVFGNMICKVWKRC
jgi:hypothetical protein